MKKKTIEYYTINSKVLPAKQNSTSRYSSLIENWFKKGFRIVQGTDATHYFTLTTLDTLNYKSELLYYGVVSKFVKIDEIDFVDSETGELVEFELPSNIEARSQQYEFIFMPSRHRFAFVKVGKIDNEINKKGGAPLKKMADIIKKAFDNGLEGADKTFVEIEQDAFVFDDIFANRILSLQVRVTYTNDDHLDNEHKKLMDSMLKEAGIAEMFSRMTPDNTGDIQSDKKITNGLIGLARENGEVNALIEYSDGGKKRINTREYPAVVDITVEDNSAAKTNIILEILSRFLRKYNL